MKNLTFVTAVLLAVQDLTNLQPNGFSIHEVTKRLREQVKNADLTFSDRTIEDVDGVQTYRVDHAKVREVFHELFDNKIIDLERQYNGGYWVFVLKNNNYGSTPTPIVPPNVIPMPTPVPAPNDTDKDIVDKTSVYVERFGHGDEITMKQIQSRFKGVPRTCEQFADILENAGFTINRHGDSASKWVLVVE